MGIFDGKVICCDIDGTLIDDNFKIPQKNIDAIDYFKKEGGQFTLATGRTTLGMKIYQDIVKPDLPVVCQNGSAIYDFKKQEYIWHIPLKKEARQVAEAVLEKFPDVGVEIMSVKDSYTVRENHATRKHESDELFKFKPATFETIPEDWLKMVFAHTPCIVDEIQEMLEKSTFYKEYLMMRSYCTYFEFVARETDKGNAIAKLESLYSFGYENLTVIGDNQNDCKMLTLPCKSFAPSSAADIAKECADTVLKSSNNDGILPEVLELLLEK